MNYIDLQVNGYFGADFNTTELTAEGLHAACEAMRKDAVTGFLATLITDHVGRLCDKLRLLVRLREQDPLARQMILGFHIEGPFLNETPGYIGAHPAPCARPADPDAAQKLLDAAGGLARIVTLAPERDPGMKTTRHLADRGIVVSAGHCNPSLDQLRAALDAGLSMFTHLGNGCPMTMHRHDNIVQRVLSVSDRLWISFIADGAHIPWPALGNYLKCVPAERVVIVSDAIVAAGLGPGRYAIGDQQAVIGDDLVPRSPHGPHLVGSACPMRRMAENLREHLRIPTDQIERWLCENPRKVLGIDPS